MKSAAVLVLALMATLCHAKDLANPHVVNGDEAEPHAYPYMVSLQGEKQGDHRCGASLISDEWVLTAAHCVDGKQINTIYVLLGAHNMTVKEETQQKIQVSEVIIHPGWSLYTIVNDIAVLKLKERARLGGNAVKTIRLPKLSDKNKSFYNWEATLTGWGDARKEGGHGVPAALQVTTERVMSNILCKAAFAFQYVEETNICLHGIRYKSGCHGDSGGPLIVTEEDAERTLVGVVSFIFPECHVWPTAFVRVSSYLEWINEKTGIPFRK